MGDKAPRNNAHCTIPDDPEQSTYRFIIVAAKRARQLQGGARPVLPTSSKKPTIIAVEEVRRGLVKYSLTGPVPKCRQPSRSSKSRSSNLPVMKIILGVGGGIAAYKAAELARLLMQQGHQVQAVMTAPPQEFVQPLTFAALTGRKVLTDLFAIEERHRTHLRRAGARTAGGRPRHRRPDRQIRPRSGGRFPHHALPGLHRPRGYRARHERQHVAAPRHARPIWKRCASAATASSSPDSGYLACGMTGPGRLAEPEAIAAAIAAGDRAAPRSGGEAVLITAGPTQEPLDPVRYISNRSSGKMGYALAEAAAARGAQVILISGPVHLPPPRGVEADSRAHRRRNARAGLRPSRARPPSSSKPPRSPISTSARCPTRRSRKPPPASPWSSIPRPISWPNWAARKATAC